MVLVVAPTRSSHVAPQEFSYSEYYCSESLANTAVLLLCAVLQSTWTAVATGEKNDSDDHHAALSLTLP